MDIAAAHSGKGRPEKADKIEKSQTMDIQSPRLNSMSVDSSDIDISSQGTRDKSLRIIHSELELALPTNNTPLPPLVSPIEASTSVKEKDGSDAGHGHRARLPVDEFGFFLETTDAVPSIPLRFVRRFI